MSYCTTMVKYNESLDDEDCNMDVMDEALVAFQNMSVTVAQDDPPEKLPIVTVTKKKTVPKKRVSLKGAKISIKHWQKKRTALKEEISLLSEAATYAAIQNDPKGSRIIRDRLASQCEELQDVEENLNVATERMKKAEAEKNRISKDAEEAAKFLKETLRQVEQLRQDDL